jgi:hypothetical protein
MVSVAADRSGNLGASGLTLMPGTGARKRLVNARFDVAFGLATDCSQFGNDKITSSFEHSLFAERKWFEVAEISEMLQDIGDFEDIACSHLLGKLFIPILPIVWGGGEIVSERFQEQFTFTVCDWRSKANFCSVGNWDQDYGIGCGKTKRIEGQCYRTDLLLLNLLDGSYPVVWVNNFLAYLKTHRSTSIDYKNQNCVAGSDLITTPGLLRRSLRHIYCLSRKV